jgi:predicted lipid-binding transport protein (Tim44 family)
LSECPLADISLSQSACPFCQFIGSSGAALVQGVEQAKSQPDANRRHTECTRWAPLAIAKSDYDDFEQLLGNIQAAYSAENLAALRAKVTPEMLSYFSEQLAGNASRGLVNRVTDVKLLQGDLAEVWREGSTDYATVAMKFALTDGMVDRASGRTVEGGERTEVTELWTFMRARGGKWLLSAIQQT